MGRRSMLFAGSLLLSGMVAGVVPATDPAGGARQSDSVVKATAAAENPRGGKQTLKITLTIDKDWHIYANPAGNPDQESSKTSVEFTGRSKPKTVKIEYPKGKLIKDALVGDYSVYEGTVEIKAIVERMPGESGPLEISIKVQACNDKTCLRPATIKLTVR